MLTGTFDLPGGLTLRPARTSDAAFLRELYAATRSAVRCMARSSEAPCP